MGLAITVGNPCTGLDEEGEEHYNNQFRLLAQAVTAKGRGWEPPTTPRPTAQARPHVSSFPYSCLHYLRRAYALMRAGLPVTPVVGNDPSDGDRHIKEVSYNLDSHLLCHADDEGYYVPVELADPLFLDRDSAVAGAGMVGSSHGLLRELRFVAPHINVNLEADDTLSDAEADRLLNNGDAPFATEQMVWLTLHEACRVSIATGHPVVFA